MAQFIFISMILGLLMTFLYSYSKRISKYLAVCFEWGKSKDSFISKQQAINQDRIKVTVQQQKGGKINRQIEVGRWIQ